MCFADCKPDLAFEVLFQIFVILSEQLLISASPVIPDQSLDKKILITPSGSDSCESVVAEVGCDLVLLGSYFYVRFSRSAWQNDLLNIY